MMGVSLERVQLKFAAIIGELCSDPDILSQFAVWLDLRLAEYKMRGAVSLVCSGQEPDPFWLKGLHKMKEKSARPHMNRRTFTSSSSHSRNQFSHGKAQQSSVSSADDVYPAQADRLSPVVVKDEPVDVFPVSLHVHNNLAAESTALPRKRSSTEPAGVDSFRGQIPAHSIPSKQRRISPNTVESPTNQSLMSVLGELTEGSANASVDTEETFVIESVSGLDMSADSPLPTRNENINSGQSSELKFMMSPSCSHDDSLSAVLDRREQASSSAGNSSLGNLGDGDLFGIDQEEFDTQSRRQFGDHVTRKKTVSEENSRRRKRLQNHGGMPEATIRNIVGAVASFERWLWSRPFDDRRGIHEIPPEELDTYLTEFYSTVKTPAGLEYKVTAMQSLRSNLDKYLEANKYPCSISKSPAFSKSQIAYKIWVASRKP